MVRHNFPELTTPPIVELEGQFIASRDPKTFPHLRCSQSIGQL